MHALPQCTPVTSSSPLKHAQHNTRVERTGTLQAEESPMNQKSFAARTLFVALRAVTSAALAAHVDQAPSLPCGAHNPPTCVVDNAGWLAGSLAAGARISFLPWFSLPWTASGLRWSGMESRYTQPLIVYHR